MRPLLSAILFLAGCATTEPDYGGCGFCGTPVPENYDLVVEEVSVSGDLLEVVGFLDTNSSRAAARASWRGEEPDIRYRGRVTVADRDSVRWNPCAPGLLVRPHYGGALYPDGRFRIRGPLVRGPNAELNIVLYNFGQSRAPIEELLASDLQRRYRSMRR